MHNLSPRAFKLFTYILIFLFSSNVLLQAQSGKLQGQIKSSDGQPVPFVSIFLKELKKGGLTDESGKYSLENLKEGHYSVVAKGIGYSQEQQAVFIRENEVTTLDFMLKASSTQLQAVEVVGRKEQTYKNSNAFSGTKTETPLKYVPQAISYVTKEVIQDRMAFKNSDVVKNISGVNQYSYNNNDFVLRGFRASNTLINGLRVSSSGWNQSLLPYVERVEVIKGPASALFANTDPGGTINTVTKKPLDENRKSIQFASGSYNTYRITSDFTGPMNESKTLLYRLNLAYQNAESFRVLQGGQDVVVAPSFSFIPDDKTQVNFDFVFSTTHGRLDRGQPIFGATAGTLLNSTPISFAIGRKSDFINEINLFSTLSLQRKISDNISFNVSYMKFMYDEDLMEHRTANRYGTDADGKAIPTLMEMQTIRRMQRNYTSNLTAYFVSNFKTGDLKHKLLVGYDNILFQTPEGNSTYNASGFLNAAGTGVVLTKSGSPAAYDSKNKALYMIKDNMPVPNVPFFNLENPDYSITDNARYFNVSANLAPAKYYVNGFYLQEQLTWNKVNILAGFRFEQYNDMLNYTKKNEQTVTQTAFIPRLGIVYTPLEPVSFYGTYTQGYQPQTASTIGSPLIYGGPFDPLISNMVEGGAKMEFFKKRLAVNLAIYRIQQNNVLVNANDAGNPDLLRQIGQQQATGVEIDAYGQITPNFSLTANLSFNKAEITKSNNEAEIGTIFPNAPRAQGGFWTKYKFTGALNGLGVGLGSNFVTERNTQDTKNNLKLPGYVLADAALFYTVDKFRLSLNLNNVFDQTHWVGGFDYNRLYPGTPRNFLIGIGYTF
ncbi:iron complex outermembrane recepter protein [Pseudarcicella hirudinis]|uniref:Iron complex outermembrane recepter protein n=1 Tax=Pseudarcicella hirudinis TaxID=1079859 RepID=A0A1I5QSJ1_9BACT|nr:TonB-dependent receptor [Pseudarcicella hirudinis]SFP49037.1 iron complex outermembrane recepter protein [Pseudarcicella hirudinis]